MCVSPLYGEMLEDVGGWRALFALLGMRETFPIVVTEQHTSPCVDAREECIENEGEREGKGEGKGEGKSVGVGLVDFSCPALSLIVGELEGYGKAGEWSLLPLGEKKAVLASSQALIKHLAAPSLAWYAGGRDRRRFRGGGRLRPLRP